MSAAQIMVVDDSSATRFIIKKLLKEALPGTETPLEAENGAVALERFKANPGLNLLLVDWNMPVMNGLEFVIEVRKLASADDVKIMMVTTETEMEQVVKSLEAGVNEYMMKPFTKEMLIEKLTLLGLN